MLSLSVSRSLPQSPTDDKRVHMTRRRRTDDKRVEDSTTVPFLNSKDPFVCSKANVREPCQTYFNMSLALNLSVSRSLTQSPTDDKRVHHT